MSRWLRVGKKFDGKEVARHGLKGRGGHVRESFCSDAFCRVSKQSQGKAGETAFRRSGGMRYRGRERVKENRGTEGWRPL